MLSGNKVRLLQRCQRVNDVDDEDVGSKDDDVHRQTDTHEVAESVAARGIDQHMGGRADGRGKAAAHADHQGNEEGIRFIAQLLGGMEHDGEEHGTCRSIRDELGSEGSDQADGGHHHEWVGSADIEDA